MTDGPTDKVYNEQVETALLDAELFLKYKAPQRALARLHETLKQHSHSIRLREKIREVAPAAGQPEEAARQCLALVQLYITREDFDAAHERLLEAKQYDPRINIATGLEAIRRARRPDLQPASPTATSAQPIRGVTFAADLAITSIFHAVHVIENARLIGALDIQVI